MILDKGDITPSVKAVDGLPYFRNLPYCILVKQWQIIGLGSNLCGTTVTFTAVEERQS